MAVFTEVAFEEASELMRSLRLGELLELTGCPGGIENTNYFAVTQLEGTRQEHVLTLFERLGFEQLPFYLHLMKHLAERGIPVPDPRPSGSAPERFSHPASALLLQVQGKPAAVVNRLLGRSELSPGQTHVEQVGAMLARMHLAGNDYDRHQPNLRGLAWWNDTVPVVLPHVSSAQAVLLQSELAHQNHIAAGAAYAALPRGPVHADLFRDNVMFEGTGEQARLSGFFDFYFAGVDTWLFDLAVCLNDWCVEGPTGQSDAHRTQAFLNAYQSVRPLERAERRLLPAMLRAGALRFWVSRLWDFHLPRTASLLQPHDPTHFERVLRQRVLHPVTLDA
jgi:homoserine kinase type II